MRELLLITGMHRSGTSAIAASAPALGFSLGDHLMPGNASNPLGHFEDLDVVAINDSLLQRFGFTWRTIRHADITLTRPDASLRDLQERARNLMRRRLAENPRFAFKDPRAVLFQRFWREVLFDLDVPLKAIVALRRPEAVASSLQARDGMPRVDALLLWLTYAHACLGIVQSIPATVVAYDHLLFDPPGELERLARFLGVTPRAEKVSAWIKDLDSKLNHHSVSEWTAGDLARTVYERLLSKAVKP